MEYHTTGRSNKADAYHNVNRSYKHCIEEKGKSPNQIYSTTPFM